MKLFSWLRISAVLACFFLASTSLKAKDIQTDQCQENLKKPHWHFTPKKQEITEEWLRENLLLGPEVTFTSKVLDSFNSSNIQPIATENLKNSASFHENNYLPLHGFLKQFNFEKEVRYEIAKFLRHVLKIKSAEILYSPTDDRFIDLNGTPIHKQPFTIRVKLQDGRDAIVTLEPSCIEVNFPPQTIDELSATWSDIFNRADQNHFKGSLHVAKGGGGGHMHLGFKNSDTNLFKNSPALIANLLLAVLNVPAIRFIFSPVNGYGSYGNAPTPLDQGKADKLVEIFHALSELEKKPSENGHDIPILQLFNHFSFISFKNFNEESPRIEIRFQRSYKRLKDILTAANFWLKLILFLYQNPSAAPVFSQIFEHASAEIFPPFHNRFVLGYLASNLKLSKEEIYDLSNFGGDSSILYVDSTGNVPALNNDYISAALGVVSASHEVNSVQFLIPVQSTEVSEITSVEISTDRNSLIYSFPSRGNNDLTFSGNYLYFQKILDNETKKIATTGLVSYNLCRKTNYIIRVMGKDGKILYEFKAQIDPSKLTHLPSNDHILKISPAKTGEWPLKKSPLYQEDIIIYKSYADFFNRLLIQKTNYFYINGQKVAGTVLDGGSFWILSAKNPELQKQILDLTQNQNGVALVSVTKTDGQLFSSFLGKGSSLLAEINTPDEVLNDLRTVSEYGDSERLLEKDIISSALSHTITVSDQKTLLVYMRFLQIMESSRTSLTPLKPE